MTTWKLPPAAKVYEALTAVADGRVRLVGPGQAVVVSSAGDKTYTVEWADDLGTFTSNDNASYWQGYLGYPIIAALIALGRVRADEAVAGQLAGIGWHALNKRFKRDYDAAVAHVLADLEARGADAEGIVRAADAVMAQLAALELLRGARSRRPPKGASSRHD